MVEHQPFKLWVESSILSGPTQDKLQLFSAILFIMDGIQEQATTYEWKYTSKDTLTPKEALEDIIGILKNRDILSVGESHNLEVDTSYNWLNEYTGDILDAYTYYRMGKIPPRVPFRLISY